MNVYPFTAHSICEAFNQRLVQNVRHHRIKVNEAKWIDGKLGHPEPMQNQTQYAAAVLKVMDKKKTFHYFEMIVMRMRSITLYILAFYANKNERTQCSILMCVPPFFLLPVFISLFVQNDSRSVVTTMARNLTFALIHCVHRPFFSCVLVHLFIRFDFVCFIWSGWFRAYSFCCSLPFILFSVITHALSYLPMRYTFQPS